MEFNQPCPHGKVYVMISEGFSKEEMHVSHNATSLGEVNHLDIDLTRGWISPHYRREMTDDQKRDYATCPVQFGLMLEALMKFYDMSMRESAIMVFLLEGEWIHHYRGW